MSHIRPYSVGLVFALVLATWHILWSVLVWLGAAFIDFIFRLHMITPPCRIAGFNLGTAAGLVLVTAGIGYVGGWAVWGDLESLHSDTKV
jgi:hypothetical protein